MTHFDDMTDDLPWINGNAVGSLKANTEILKVRGYVRGAWLLVTYTDGKTLRTGTHTYRYVRAVKGDLSTIIVRDPVSLKDFRLSLHSCEIALGKRPTKKQTTRQLLLQCAHVDTEYQDFDNVYRLRGSRTAIEINGLPICPVCGNRFELIESGDTQEQRK